MKCKNKKYITIIFIPPNKIIRKLLLKEKKIVKKKKYLDP